MFLDDFSTQPHDSIWDHRTPKIARLSHSFNDPHWNYQYHVHKNETELAYISNGKGKYTINNTSYDIQKGDILIIEKGAIHSVTSNEDNPLSCWTCAIKDYKLIDQQEEGFMLASNICPHLSSKEHEPFIHQLFLEMERIRHQNMTYTISTLDTLSNALANVYYEIFHRNAKTERPKNSSFARDILIFINENYASNISLKKLSEQFHISPDYISHEFSKVYGISPINYCIDRRISEAKWMLINTSNSLVSISRKVGYENTSHFSNLFLKRVKLSPLEFRSLYQ